MINRKMLCKRDPGLQQQIRSSGVQRVMVQMARPTVGRSAVA